MPTHVAVTASMGNTDCLQWKAESPGSSFLFLSPDTHLSRQYFWIASALKKILRDIPSFWANNYKSFQFLQEKDKGSFYSWRKERFHYCPVFSVEKISRLVLPGVCSGALTLPGLRPDRRYLDTVRLWYQVLFDLNQSLRSRNDPHWKRWGSQPPLTRVLEPSSLLRMLRTIMKMLL